MSYKTTNYWKKLEIVQRNDETPHVNASGMIKYCDLDTFDREEIEKELSEEFRHKPATRNSHFTALNCLPAVPGTRWTVSEDVYFEFLEMLPPIPRNKGGGFYISEAQCSAPGGGNIRSAYYQQGGQYWHAYEVTDF